MKINSFFNSIGFMLLMLLSFPSCKKLAEIPDPLNKVSSAQVFADSANVMGAIAGIYDNFGVAANQQTLVSGYVTLFAGLSADELVDNSSYYTQFFANTLVANNGSVGQLWSDAYTNLY